jgi:hypothetical protein
LPLPGLAGGLIPNAQAARLACEDTTEAIALAESTAAHL